MIEAVDVKGPQHSLMALVTTAYSLYQGMRTQHYAVLAKLARAWKRLGASYVVRYAEHLNCMIIFMNGRGTYD